MPLSGDLIGEQPQLWIIGAAIIQTGNDRIPARLWVRSDHATQPETARVNNLTRAVNAESKLEAHIGDAAAQRRASSKQQTGKPATETRAGSLRQRAITPADRRPQCATS